MKPPRFVNQTPRKLSRKEIAAHFGCHLYDVNNALEFGLMTPLAVAIRKYRMETQMKRMTHRQIAAHFGCSFNAVSAAVVGRSKSALAQNILEFKRKMDVEIQPKKNPVRISVKPVIMPCGPVSPFFTKCTQGCYLGNHCPIYAGPARVSGGPVGCKTGSAQKNIFQTGQQ
jgi:hypothetical protein